MTQISGKNILVTGGASGIGRKMALGFARKGGRVVILDIAQDRLTNVVEELKRAGSSGSKGFVCDVSNRDEVYEVAEKVKQEFGRIDILVNNAGIVSGKRFLEIPDEQIEATFRVNTLGMMWMTKAFLPAMVERNEGHVVNIASSSSLVGVSRLSDYAASKWAAMGFDESLRVELRKTAPGVKTTVVCPYFIDTGMFDGVKTRFPKLLPILKEDEVAEAVIRAVEKNKARVIMPRMVYLVPPLRLLPVSVFDFIADFLGVNVSMDEFVGRGNSKKGQE